MVAPAGERPELRYHAPTHTLLVKATSVDAERVSRLIEALEVPAQSDAMKEYEGKLAELRQQLDAANKQLTEVKRLAETYGPSSPVVQKAAATQPTP